MGKSKVNNSKAYYERVFLKQSKVNTRSAKSAYIRKEHHERIMRIIHVIGGHDYTLFDYLDNVLEQHFATYKDEINTLYHERTTDIF